MWSLLRSFVRRYHKLLFYSSWLLLNLIQAKGTGLFDDEAYYWLYSKFPAWGYFDHPPMVAWLIKAGYFLQHDELGTRLFIVLMGTGALYLIQALTGKKNDRLFYAIAGSMAVLQIGGIMAVPDIPLLFFTALFFLTYRRFLTDYSLTNSLLLGIVTAGLLYSKYHGFLIVACVLIAHPRLFTRYQTYIAGGVTLLLFFPHLYWQYAHGFPSIQYHLFERNAGHYQLAFTLEYLDGQLVLPGPFVGIILLWAAFHYRPKDQTERALKFSLVGIYGLFLLSSFKGRVEANWTIAAFVPLMVLGHQYLLQSDPLRKWIYRLLLPSLILVFTARVYMLANVKPAGWVQKDEFHKTRSWAKDIAKKAGRHPVVFLDSYQRASQYWFYTGQETFSLNTINYRRNNFNFWPVEENFFGKKVLLLNTDFQHATDTVHTPKEDIGGLWIPDYYSFSRIRMRARGKLVVKNGVSDTIRIAIYSEKAYRAKTIRPPLDTLPVLLSVYLGEDEDSVQSFPTGIRLQAIDRDTVELPLCLRVPIAAGTYNARLSIPTCIPKRPTINSTHLRLEVE